MSGKIDPNAPTKIKTAFGTADMNIILPGGKDVKTFKDVAGLTVAKQAMKDLISSRNNKLGAKPLKGILMTGDPGNGKTLLATAVAGELNLPFIGTSSADFKSSYQSGGATQVRNVFKAARALAVKYGSCIIFIDEIDAIAKNRKGLGNSEDNASTVTALLDEMDGMKTKDEKASVIVLAATNIPDSLDSAITRAGRFDRKVEVPKPNAAERKELLTIVLKPIPQERAIMRDLHRFVEATNGFSGADVANVVNEAVILAGNANRDQLTLEDLDLALNNIRFGNEINNSDLDDEDKADLALYQAGRSIATDILDKNQNLEQISIIPREKNKLGALHTSTIHHKKKLSLEDMANSIIIELAGSLAQVEYGAVDKYNMIIDEKVYELAYMIILQTNNKFQEYRNIPYSSVAKLPFYEKQPVKEAMNNIIGKYEKEALILVQEQEMYIKLIAELIWNKGTIFGQEFYRALSQQKLKNQNPAIFEEKTKKHLETQDYLKPFNEAHDKQSYADFAQEAYAR